MANFINVGVLVKPTPPIKPTLPVKPTPPEADPFSTLLGIEPRAWLGALLVLLALAVGVALTLGLRRWFDGLARRRRGARAERAERNAAVLLEAHGFEVIGRQVRQSWSIWADAEEVQFTLIADYLVQRGGRRWVAEVKTGERALDLRHGPTRRQLLEYRQAFAVDGVLLVDAEGQKLCSVQFREPLGARRVNGLAVFAAGLVAGLSLAGYWFFAHTPGTF
jgi:hypothetical protein